MGTFLRMFLFIFLITVGACSKKQAPRHEAVKVVVIYPCDYEKSEYWDPQNYDEVDEEE